MRKIWTSARTLSGPIKAVWLRIHGKRRDTRNGRPTTITVSHVIMNVAVSPRNRRQQCPSHLASSPRRNKYRFIRSHNQPMTNVRTTDGRTDDGHDNQHSQRNAFYAADVAEDDRGRSCSEGEGWVYHCHGTRCVVCARRKIEEDTSAAARCDSEAT